MTAEDAFLPLFESLNWLAALSHLQTAGKIAIAGQSLDLRALRFARDRAHHHWGNALEVGDVLVPRMIHPGRVRGVPRSAYIQPVVVRAWTWVSLTRLAGRSDAEGEAAYIAKLENQPGHVVLDCVSLALSALR
jgi:hypothetical protein